MCITANKGLTKIKLDKPELKIQKIRLIKTKRSLNLLNN